MSIPPPWLHVNGMCRHVELPSSLPHTHITHTYTQVNDKWKRVEFTANAYKEMKDTYILGGVDEVNHPAFFMRSIHANRSCTWRCRFCLCLCVYARARVRVQQLVRKGAESTRAATHLCR